MTTTNATQNTGAPQGSNTSKATSTNRQRPPYYLSQPSTLPEMNYMPQSQMDILVPGLPKHNIFVCGEKNQVDRYIKARKGLIDWVGTSKDYKNVMHSYLLTKDEPTFDDPDEPTGTDANPVTTAQLEKYKFQLRKIDDKREEWLEAKGRLCRTVEQLCVIPLQNKVHDHPRCGEVQKKHDIIGLLDIIKELVYSTDDSQETYWTMVETMTQLFNTKQGDQEPLTAFDKRLESQIEVTESVWGGAVGISLVG